MAMYLKILMIENNYEIGGHIKEAWKKKPVQKKGIQSDGGGLA